MRSNNQAIQVRSKQEKTKEESEVRGFWGVYIRGCISCEAEERECACGCGKKRGGEGVARIGELTMISRIR